MSKRERAVLVTVFNMADRHATQYGTCIFIEKNGQVTGDIPDKNFAELVLSDSLDVLEHGKRPQKSTGNTKSSPIS